MIPIVPIHLLVLESPLTDEAVVRALCARAGFPQAQVAMVAGVWEISVAPEGRAVHEITGAFYRAAGYHALNVLLGVPSETVPPPAPRWRVTADFLNVRSAPVSDPANILGQLPRGAVVTQTGPAADFWIPHDSGGALPPGWSSARYMERII